MPAKRTGRPPKAWTTELNTPEAPPCFRGFSFQKGGNLLQLSEVRRLSSVVEHFHGKEGVSSSSLEGGSIFVSNTSHNPVFMLELIRLQ